MFASMNDIFALIASGGVRQRALSSNLQQRRLVMAAQMQ